jgi:hypothetical protein
MGRRMHGMIYVHNKSLPQTLKNITPKEAFTGVNPDIEHFRIFWCLVYFHVPKEHKYKLDPLERKDTMNLQKHSRSKSLVKDRLRQAKMLSLNKR